MVTGALLIKREYEKKEVLNRFMKHNWFGLFRTTEIWLIIMFLYLQVFPSSSLRTGGILNAIKSFFETLIFVNQETMASMWYMAMILVVYLMIPLFSIGLRKLGDKYVGVLCSVAVLIGMIMPNIKTAAEACGGGYRHNRISFEC